MKNILRAGLILLAFMWLSPAFAQSALSPYSVIGIGELMPIGNARNVGMGGMGVSTPSLTYGSQINPSFLPFNAYTLLDLNVGIEYKNILSGNKNTTDISGNLFGAHLSFPVMRGRYGMAVGVRPMSIVNYALNSEHKIAGAPAFVTYNYKGSGGVSQAYWAHGVRITKWLSMGLEGQYLFGSVTNESRSSISDGVTGIMLDVIEQTTFSNLAISPSLHTAFKLDSLHSIQFGLVYKKQRDMSVAFERQVQRRTVTDATLDADTLSIGKGDIRLPQGLTAGISFHKQYHYAFGVDVSTEKWSTFSSSIRTQKLVDAMRVSVGGEWTPNITSVNSYLKRVTYRAGVRYEKTPWSVNDMQIEDFSINFGASLPVYRGYANLNWALSAGRRGTVDNNLIQENYFRLSLGLTINDAQWFIRRRIN